MSKKMKIGPYSAYAIAVKYGYTGTEEQWVKEQEANRVASEQAAQQAGAARDNAETAATRAETARQQTEEVRTDALDKIDSAKSDALEAVAAKQTSATAAVDTAKGAAVKAVTDTQSTATQAVDAARDKAVEQVDAATEAAKTAANEAATSAGNASTSAQQAAGSLQELKDGITSGNFKGEKGDRGEKGDTGETGPAATVAVGTVTGLGAGAAPTVTNSGDEHNAVLDFGIPTASAIDIAVDVLFKLPRTGKVYTVKIPRFATNPTVNCEKLDDNAGLVCEPSTDTVEGRDDYADIPLFKWYNCNYKRDASGRAYPTAIEHLSDDYRKIGTVDVGVIQMTPYVKWDASNPDYILWSITDSPRDGFTPWAAAKSGDTVYPYVIHSKFFSGVGEDTSKNAGSSAVWWKRTAPPVTPWQILPGSTRAACMYWAAPATS